MKPAWETTNRPFHGRQEADQISRAASRNRLAAISGATAVVARAVQVGVSLLTIPLTIHYLGNERFGLWMAITSVLAMANFADFGIGNGVLNIVADADGKNQIDKIRETISSGFAVLTVVGLSLLVVFAASFFWFSWADVFRVTSNQARLEAAPALFVFASCFAINIPLDLVQRSQLALQQGFRTNLWQIAGSFLALAGVLIGIRLHVGLPTLVAAVAGAPIAATALNFFQFFSFERPDLRPRAKLISRTAIIHIVRFGSQFFILQLVVAIAFSADNFIIARTLGAASVPDYSIPQRVFSLISVMVTMLVTPLWPAYGEAISRGEMQWVRTTLRRSLLSILVGASLASLILLSVAPRLIAWWIGPHIAPPFFLLLGLALWTVTDCCGNTLAMFLNGASIMRFQIVIASIFGVVCVTLKVYLTRRFGIAAVPWVTLATYLSVVGVSCVLFVPHALRRLIPHPSPVVMATPVVED